MPFEREAEQLVLELRALGGREVRKTWERQGGRLGVREERGGLSGRQLYGSEAEPAAPAPRVRARRRDPVIIAICRRLAAGRERRRVELFACEGAGLGLGPSSQGRLGLLQEVQPPEELWSSPVKAVEGAALDERLGLVRVGLCSLEEVWEGEEGAARPARVEQPLGEVDAHPFDE